jgi:hypothetical protein
MRADPTVFYGSLDPLLQTLHPEARAVPIQELRGQIGPLGVHSPKLAPKEDIEQPRAVRLASAS